MPRLEHFSSAAFFAFHRLINGLGLSVWRGLILSIARGPLAPFTGAAASASPSASAQQGLRMPFPAKSSFNIAGITGRSRGRRYSASLCLRQAGAPYRWRYASALLVF